MTSPAKRLFNRQMSRAAVCGGTTDLARLRGLVIGAFADADRNRRRIERSARLMAVELEEANAALGHSVSDLLSQNQRLGVALDNMANGLALFGADGRLVVCNRRQRENLAIPDALKLPGISFEQFLRSSPVLSEIAIKERLQLAAARVEAEPHQTLLDGHEIRVAFRPTRDRTGRCCASGSTRRSGAALVRCSAWISSTTRTAIRSATACCAT
nr:PAS-domain containing protein [uncultured Lichenicoccus sp.]